MQTHPEMFIVIMEAKSSENVRVGDKEVKYSLEYLILKSRERERRVQDCGRIEGKLCIYLFVFKA